MRFAVTGASGFLGRRLVPHLEAAGHEVSILGRAPRTGMSPTARFFIWDPAQPPTPQSLEGADVVVHLAGEAIAQRWSPEVKRRIETSRTEGTARLIDGIAALEEKPKVLLAASAIGYYGDRGEEVLTESSAPGRGFLPEVCAAWEKASMQASELGLRTVLLRTGVVLGPEGGALAKMLPPFRFGAGGRIGSGDQWMSWIHVEDMIRLFPFAAETVSLSGPVNATAPNPVTNSDFTHALGRALRRPAIFPVPLFAIRLLFGEMSEVLTSSQRVQPRAAAAAGFEFRHPEVFAALKDLLA